MTRTFVQLAALACWVAFSFSVVIVVAPLIVEMVTGYPAVDTWGSTAKAGMATALGVAGLIGGLSGTRWLRTHSPRATACRGFDVLPPE